MVGLQHKYVVKCVTKYFNKKSIMMHLKPDSSSYIPIYLSFLIAIFVIVNGCGVNHGLDEDTYAKIYMPQAKTVPAAHTVIVGIDTVQAIDYGATYGGPGSPK